MRRIWYLSTCDTCKRVIKELGGLSGFEMQDIKNAPVTEKELDILVTLAGSHEALFSRNSNLYKGLGLKDKTLTEAEMRSYLLCEYTMLKRPVIVDGNKIFIGNSKNTVAEAKKHFGAK
jgi:arsenate reductase